MNVDDDIQGGPWNRYGVPRRVSLSLVAWVVPSRPERDRCPRAGGDARPHVVGFVRCSTPVGQHFVRFWVSTLLTLRDECERVWHISDVKTTENNKKVTTYKDQFSFKPPSVLLDRRRKKVTCQFSDVMQFRWSQWHRYHCRHFSVYCLIVIVVLLLLSTLWRI